MKLPIDIDNPFAQSLMRWLSPDLNMSWIEACNAFAAARQQRVRFVIAGSQAMPALGYEQTVVTTQTVPTRDNMHDALNAAMWLAYPNAKWALSSAHLKAQQSLAPGELRSPRRDALTGFDESGVVVLASNQSILEGIRDFKWQQVFIQQRAFLNTHARLLIFGHGLFESLHHPFIGLTGKAILLEAPQDIVEGSFAQQLAFADHQLEVILGDHRKLASPRELSPLPVLGWPGWFDANEDPAFYNQTHYFRSGRGSRLNN
jgi:hypothetical protein